MIPIFSPSASPVDASARSPHSSQARSLGPVGAPLIGICTYQGCRRYTAIDSDAQRSSSARQSLSAPSGMGGGPTAVFFISVISSSLLAT